MLQAPKRRPRCILTGAPVGPHDAVAILRTPAHRRKPGYLEAQGNLIAAPQTLHRNVQEGAVGLEYALPFLLFLEQDDPAAWWESYYGVERVQRGLISEGDTLGE